MGHIVMHEVYPAEVSRKSVQADWNDYAAHEDWQEGCTGVNPIRWLDRKPVCKSYDEAMELIEAEDKGWYDCLAVRFYNTLPNKADAARVIDTPHS